MNIVLKNKKISFMNFLKISLYELKLIFKTTIDECRFKKQKTNFMNILKISPYMC